MTFQEMVNRRMEEKGWKVSDLVAASGVSEDSIRRSRRGQPIHDHTARRIGEALEIPYKKVLTAKRPRQTRTTKPQGSPQLTIECGFAKTIPMIWRCRNCGSQFIGLADNPSYCPWCGMGLSGGTNEH